MPRKDIVITITVSQGGDIPSTTDVASEREDNLNWEARKRLMDEKERFERNYGYSFGDITRESIAEERKKMEEEDSRYPSDFRG